jgi:hypothetical protein
MNHLSFLGDVELRFVFQVCGGQKRMNNPSLHGKGHSTHIERDAGWQVFRDLDDGQKEYDKYQPCAPLPSL